MFLKKDEYNVDFDDPRGIAVLQWDEIVESALENLHNDKDREIVKDPRTYAWVLKDIKTRIAMDPSSRSFCLKMMPLPDALETLCRSFTKALTDMYPVDLSPVWGLVYLNVKLALGGPKDRLGRTAEWSERLRRAVERFSRIYRLFGDDKEGTFGLISMMEHTVAIMAESARFLRRIPARRSEDDYAAWGPVGDKIASHQREIDDAIKHMSEVNNFSIANQQAQIKNLEIRHALREDDDERARFPVLDLPYKRNERFYGRQSELDEIDRCLRPDPTSHPKLRTYSIYGRRGIGKTELAQEYAYRNPSRFDAIFWIGCDTSLSLRNSFTNAAIKLNIPGADTKRNHEENLLNVQKWLKQTKKRWMMIFDNADKESELILRSYWPIGATGAILITSRDYYNFTKDKQRKGATVKAFNDTESWELLQHLLKDQWDPSALRNEDIVAANLWIKELGGLALSIAAAASLISSPKSQTGSTIAETYAIYRTRREELPPRQLGSRPSYIHTLDALYDMNFKALSTNARDLLSVLSLLAPDEIPIQLFLPRKQSVLTGILEFAKQESPIYVNEATTEVPLSSVVNLAPKLSAAIEELFRSNLIKWDHKTVAIHRVVAEAMNWNSKAALQESFAICILLVYEAFPKQTQGNTLYESWKTCESYITHAVHLAKELTAYQHPKVLGELLSTPMFAELFANVAWYLYEVGDYDLGNEIIDIAKAACKDKDSHIFAILCNVQGCNFIELNKMKETRRNYEQALQIFQKRNDPYKGDLADVLHNLGNLESATGHFEDAERYYNQAMVIYPILGDIAANRLANTYMGMGRCHAWKGQPGEARRFFSQAEQLYIRSKGPDNHFMANCYYGYGNLEFEEKSFSHATRSYEACLKIATNELPIHPITAAAFYRLGCTEFEMGNIDRAMAYLLKARNIAELRSPNRDDGTIARILFRTAMVMKRNPAGMGVVDTKESEELLDRAYAARAALIDAGEGIEIDRVEEMESKTTDRQLKYELDEKSFDLLVPGLFR